MKKMIIDCISDLHGSFVNLEGGDLLIVAGDLTAKDTPEEYLAFLSWLHKQKYKHYIFIAGNRDNSIERGDFLTTRLADTTYLCDSGTEFYHYRTDEIQILNRQCFKIWGSPWTKRFDGMNPDCMAFTVDTDEELAQKWALIPHDTDILITHSPAYKSGDQVNNGPYPINAGSLSLCNKIRNDLNLKLHVFGHIHEGYGCDEPTRIKDGSTFHSVNASHVNEYYRPVNKPIRIEL